MAHVLDNPIWHALSAGPHRDLATGRGLARHYPRDVVPFSAVSEPSDAAYRDLATDLPPGAEARLFRPAEDEPTPAGWTTLSARPILQMVAHSVSAEDGPARGEETEWVPLGTDDAEAMMALAETAKPGPFARRTVILGAYLGLRARGGGPLLAMAGERFRIEAGGFVELSAICTHPEARRRGFAAALTLRLTRAALERGDVPFLHVFPENAAAVALYERLGFRTRRTLWVVWRRPESEGTRQRQ